MKFGTVKWEKLRSKLESAAFKSAQAGDKETHAYIVQALVLLSELQSACSTPESEGSLTDANAAEIAKVVRRIKHWAKRPNQINARILTAYLRLERTGASVITEADLKKEMPEKFDANFLQMRIIAGKNHGKIFELYGDRVSLWPPVVPAVREFERHAFGDT